MHVVVQVKLPAKAVTAASAAAVEPAATLVHVLGRAAVVAPLVVVASAVPVAMVVQAVW